MHLTFLGYWLGVANAEWVTYITRETTADWRVVDDTALSV